jgi:ABC-type transport system substrate-binding protein
VNALDKRTLQVHLSGPDSEFLTLLSMPPFWLSDPGKPGQPSAGSGPYRLDQWQPGVQLRLTANPNYWGGSPQVRSVTITIVPDNGKRLDRFIKGEADVAHGFTGPELLTFERDPGHAAELHRVRLARTSWLGFNTIAGSGYKPAVRMALAQAIDRGRLTDLAQFGSLLASPADDLLPPAIPGHVDRNFPAYNPPSAKFALDQASFPSRIDLYTSTNSTVGRVARELQAQIGEASGRTVILHPLGDFFRQASLDRLPLFIDTWSADVPHPADILENVLRSGGQFNNLGLSDPRVDGALDLGRTAGSFDQALAAYQQAEQIALDDARLIPLYTGVEPYLVRAGIRVSFTSGVIPYRWEDVR